MSEGTPKKNAKLVPSVNTSIKFKTAFKNCILKALKNRKWKEADNEGDWNLYWGEKDTIQETLDRVHLNPNQRVNHFRNHYELTKKDHLMRNLKKFKRQLEKENKYEEAATFDFFPNTYNLPNEYPVFCDDFKKGGNNIWIMKPTGKSQGKGIFLFDKLSQISDWKLENRYKADNPQVENYVVQRYIKNPLLIGGKKFDLRLYCLVTSFAPLTAYLYRDGFARFTHHRYSNNDLTNTFVHLTNVAIQKTSENYDNNLGGKWDVGKLKQYLVSKYGQARVNECFLKIQSLITKTLQSVQKLILNNKHCFELYGFDILLDSNLKPWLIEVNGSPSMTANTEQDSKLKCKLLDDVFTVIDLEKRLTGQEDQIGGFDIIYRENSTKPLPAMAIGVNMLGCKHDESGLFAKLSRELMVDPTNDSNKKAKEKKEAKGSTASKQDRTTPKSMISITKNVDKPTPLAATISGEKSCSLSVLPPLRKMPSLNFLTVQQVNSETTEVDLPSIERLLEEEEEEEEPTKHKPLETSLEVDDIAQIRETEAEEEPDSGLLAPETKQDEDLPFPALRELLSLPSLQDLSKRPTAQVSRQVHPLLINGRPRMKTQTDETLQADFIKMLKASKICSSKDGPVSASFKVRPPRSMRSLTMIDNIIPGSRDLPGYKTFLKDQESFMIPEKTDSKTLAESMSISKIKSDKKILTRKAFEACDFTTAPKDLDIFTMPEKPNKKVLYESNLIGRTQFDKKGLKEEDRYVENSNLNVVTKDVNQDVKAHKVKLWNGKFRIKKVDDRRTPRSLGVITDEKRIIA